MELKNLADFTSLAIKLASPDQVKSWSRGEITKPETINYRTLKPEKDGLFDERIFGPTKDWECYCGKYKRIRYRGVVCDKCGVEVTQSRVRRERMGHITLSSTVAHVWFFKGSPSKLSVLLELPSKALEQVIYLARYIVVGVDEDKRKEALAKLEKARKELEAKQARAASELEDEISREFKKLREEKKKEIKDKERLALALHELDLDQRRRKTSASEVVGTSLAPPRELYERLTELVRRIAPKTFLSEEESQELVEHDLSFATAKTGAEAIADMLEAVNLDELAASLREELTQLSSSRYIKVAQRLRLVEGMRRAGISPVWLVLRVLPVIPPDLRPMVQLSGGRFATSDLNDLYRRIINRNNRLRHLFELGAPEIILRNERRMLQEAVDSFIDSTQRQSPRRGRTRQPLRSLSDMLRGKQGRFRQNLLGKRVDYSGRSVIVVGPELYLDQCGLPKEMALELFKPFVLREMIAQGIAPNVKSAKNMLDRRLPEVFDILEDITRDHPVLLNRAPTLHKLGIQAFYPVLIEGNAIRIHPCVCPGYNADFDGDQMAVHVPLSQRAKDEARNLMLPEHNLLKPADGSPITIPSTKEMALGVYYLTTVSPQLRKVSLVGDKNDAIFAYQTQRVSLRQAIEIVDGAAAKIETTVGRILFSELLPSWMEFVNEPVSAGVLKRIFNTVFARGSRAEILEMIDNIKNIGFTSATVSGLSFGMTDAVILPQKEEMIGAANAQVAEIEQNFRNGLITEEEKRRLTQEVWIESTEDLADKTWAQFSDSNPIKIIIDAGVGRASREQVKQIAAMRGLVVDPLGRVVDLPTKSNFREGLSIFEYVSTARGSRKGLTDQALKTADAGYLTRRLVDVTHDVIVRSEDCGTEEGLIIKKIDRQRAFTGRILGRVAAQNIKDKTGKNIIVRAGSEVTEDAAMLIDQQDIGEVVVRSPLTCQARFGVCAACYGWDLSTKRRVELGTPVGVIAAQSIGEPGTQLTMRMKHAGGIVGLDVTQGLPRIEELFEARVPKMISPLSEISGKVEVAENEDSWRVRVRSVDVKPPEEREYTIPKVMNLQFKEGDMIAAGTQFAAGQLDIKQVLAIRGRRAAQEYLISEIQSVYEAQGIPINDKHFEVIVRRMSDKVQVLTTGDTMLLPRELVDKIRFAEENSRVLAAGGEPATAQVVILGITKASLLTESWLSASSFQETTKVLTEAALLGKEDKLIGLKENVIIGRLIPATPERAVLPNNTPLPQS